MKKFIYFTLLTLLASSLFVGCEEEKPSTGIINLSLTADPVVEQYIANAYLTITKIQVYQNDTWINFEGFQGPQKFSISDLTNGRTASLGNITADAGAYSKLRFFFDAPELNSPDNTESGCYIDFSPHMMLLLVPDDSPDSWEAVGSFEVPANGEVEITVAFNIRKSMLNWSSNYGYILYPTFRLVNDDKVGTITGIITNMPLEGNIAIYAYQNGAFTDSEVSIPEEDTNVRFPNSVTNGTANPNYNYNLQFLPPGTYDLAVTFVRETGFYENTIGIVEDVLVESSKTTNKPIDLISFQ